jgi:hypothetical protein
VHGIMLTNADRAQKLDACMAFYTSAYRLTHDNRSMDVSMAVSMASLELPVEPPFLAKQSPPAGHSTGHVYDPNTRPTNGGKRRPPKLGPCSIYADRGALAFLFVSFALNTHCEHHRGGTDFC